MLREWLREKEEKIGGEEESESESKEEEEVFDLEEDEGIFV